jgi:hypothetical protein
VKYKLWDIEDAFTLMKALELRLSPINLHAAIPNAKEVHKTGRLSLRIYGNKIDEKEKANVRSLLTATEMKLKNIDDGKERWIYGRGKNARLVVVTYD